MSPMLQKLSWTGAAALLILLRAAMLQWMPAAAAPIAELGVLSGLIIGWVWGQRPGDSAARTS